VDSGVEEGMKVHSIEGWTSLEDLTMLEER